MVTCRKCQQVQPAENFYRFSPGTRKGCCKVCTRTQLRRHESPESERRRRIRRKFGLDAPAYDLLLTAQDHVCAICGAAEGAGDGRRLTVDHDHATGVVRGLLCVQCNGALGSFRDSPENLARAIEYLAAPPAPPLIGAIVAPVFKKETRAAADGSRLTNHEEKSRVSYDPH